MPHDFDMLRGFDSDLNNKVLKAAQKKKQRIEEQITALNAKKDHIKKKIQQINIYRATLHSKLALANANQQFITALLTGASATVQSFSNLPVKAGGGNNLAITVLMQHLVSIFKKQNEMFGDIYEIFLSGEKEKITRYEERLDEINGQISAFNAEIEELNREIQWRTQAKNYVERNFT